MGAGRGFFWKGGGGGSANFIFMGVGIFSDRFPKLFLCNCWGYWCVTLPEIISPKKFGCVTPKCVILRLNSHERNAITRKGEQFLGK